VKIPRDCNGAELVRALRHLGYETQRQTGSHIQMTTQRGGEHHVSIPNHRPLKSGFAERLAQGIGGAPRLDGGRTRA
jgi:predicted RNA binding protein YcfA (HicA-like mRNA interferase family)